MRPYVRITGTSFLVVFLILAGGNLTLVMLLPLLVLSAPFKLIWRKKNKRWLWRSVSIGTLIFGLILGLVAAAHVSLSEDGGEILGFPFRSQLSESYFEVSLDGDVLLSALSAGLNVTTVTLIVFLPVTIASLVDTVRNSRRKSSEIPG